MGESQRQTTGDGKTLPITDFFGPLQVASSLLCAVRKGRAWCLSLMKREENCTVNKDRLNEYTKRVPDLDDKRTTSKSTPFNNVLMEGK